MGYVVFRRFRKSRDVFELLVQHIELGVRACEKVIEELMSRDERHRIESLAAEVDALEKHGDELAAEVTRILVHSSIPLTMYGDMHKLIDMIDNILDELYFIAQEINRGRRANLDSNTIVVEIYQDLASMMAVAKLAVDKLRELMSIAMEDVEKAKALGREVDRLEDRVDELRNGIIDKIYSLREKLDSLAIYHLIELTKAIDRVVDSCKDSAHLALSIVATVLG